MDVIWFIVWTSFTRIPFEVRVRYKMNVAFIISVPQDHSHREVREVYEFSFVLIGSIVSVFVVTLRVDTFTTKGRHG